MPVRRVDLRVLLLLAAVGLTACTSNAADESPPVPVAGTSATPALMEITSVADLSRVLHLGVDPLTAAGIEVEGNGPQGSFSGDGAMTLADGRLTELEISGPPSSSSDADRILIAGDDAYVRPESIDGTPAELWRPVLATSTEPTVSKAAGSAVAVAALANLGPLADALSAGTSFDDVGVVTGGNRYGINSFAPTARLASLSGAEVVPTRAYVDIDVNGRPIEANVLFTVDGANYTVQARWTDYDEPVTIDPPSADEIATD